MNGDVFWVMKLYEMTSGYQVKRVQKVPKNLNQKFDFDTTELHQS